MPDDDGPPDLGEAIRLFVGTVRRLRGTFPLWCEAAGLFR